MNRPQSSQFFFWLAFAPTTFWLAVFFIFPLLIIGTYSFGENVSVNEIVVTGTLENYARIFEPPIPKVIWETAWVTGLGTLICLLIGFPVALVIATARPRWKPWLLLVIILPFWTNLVIRAVAFESVLGVRGPLNEVLGGLWFIADDTLDTVGLGAFHLIGEAYEPLRLTSTYTGVILGLVFVHLPFTVLPIYVALERLDRSYLEASLDLGASQLRTITSILIPLTSAGLSAAVIITFIPMLGSFIIPALIGKSKIFLLANVIERDFKDANNWPNGAAISMLLLLVTFIVLALQSRAALRQEQRRHASS